VWEMMKVREVRMLSDQVGGGMRPYRALGDFVTCSGVNQ
jgi:hypothetical protein